MSSTAIRRCDSEAHPSRDKQGRAIWTYGPVALAAVVISLPSLWAGLFDDDLWQRRFVLAHLQPGHADGWWQMFGTPLSKRIVAGLIFHGLVPWWTSPNFQLSFFRPLAAATHYFDYWLWPTSLVLMHLQSVIWYGILCVLVAKYYHVVVRSGTVACLAAYLFAVDEAHLDAVAWLAARNSILTAVFGVLALVLLSERKSKHSYIRPTLAALSLALAHLSSEAALAVWAYLLGNALFARRKPIGRTLLELLPCAIVSITCCWLTRHLGFGVVGSGAYIDPLVRPHEFALAALERFPHLLAAQFGPPAWASELLGGSGVSRPYQAACVVGWGVTCAVGASRVWRKPELHALLAGTLGSALVMCTARAEPRLLLVVGIGAHALCAELMLACWQALPGGSHLQRIGAVFGVLWIGLLHLLLPLGGSYAVPESYRERHRGRILSASRMEIGPDDRQRVVLILNAPSYFDALSICTYRLSLDVAPWRALHILGTSDQPTTLSRIDSSTLVVAPRSGYLLETTSRQARSPDEPFHPGQAVALEGLNVVIETTTSSGRPVRVRLELAADHERSLRFLNWNAAKQTFERLALPSIGSQSPL